MSRGVSMQAQPELNPPQAPYPTPEVVPSREHQEPRIGPNLATDTALATEVLKYLRNDFWWPYLMQQMQFWTVWRQLDEAWRAQMQAIDLDLSIFEQGRKALEVATEPNVRDGFTLKISPTDFHKQCFMLERMGQQISFQEGIPVGAVKPKYVFENLYNPTQQTVDAANEILDATAEQCGLKDEWRKNFHSFVTYGAAWGVCDFRRSFMDVECRYALAADMFMAQQQLFALRQKYGRAELRIESTPQGPVAIFSERQVKEFVTEFDHADIDCVLTDTTMPCNDMEAHPCPWLRRRVGEFAIEQNPYDPEKNPFGYANIQTAIHDSKGQFTFQQPDEGPIRERLAHRYGNWGWNQLKSRHMQKQLWTAWPMLRIDERGQLDTGNGVPCPHCGGKGRMEQVNELNEPMGEVPCRECGEKGIVHPPARRFIAQFYGDLYGGASTCLRLQEMPEGQLVPLVFAADMIEDTAGAYPVSKGEIVLNDLYLLAEYENILLRSSRAAVRRGWFVYEDSPAWGKDFSKPDTQIPTGNKPDQEVMRMDANSFDERLTLGPLSDSLRARIENSMGVVNILQGQAYAPGRRPMGEVANAIDAARTPIVTMTDGYNQQMMGGWARHVFNNMDLWGDRDFIRRKTGREYFGNLRFQTAAGEEFMRKMNRIQNERYVLEAGVNNPALQSVMPAIAQRLLDDMGMADIRVPDGGVKKAQQDGNRIVSRILGDGVLLPPSPMDPHEIYVEIFRDAIRAAQEDPQDYWYDKSATTIPLLMQRLQMQELLLQQQMLMQMQMQAAMNPQPEGPQNNGSGKKMTREHPSQGGAMQGAQGPQGEAGA